MRRSTLWPTVTALSIVALALAAAPAVAQEHAGQYSQADISFGMRVYGETCVACHGPDGDAVDGDQLPDRPIPVGELRLRAHPP